MVDRSRNNRTAEELKMAGAIREDLVNWEFVEILQQSFEM